MLEHDWEADLRAAFADGQESVRAALATLIHTCPMGFHDGKLIAGRSFTDADMIAWLQDLQRLATP